MRAYLQQLIYRVKGSYWFIPSLMVIGAMTLAQTGIWFDRAVGNDWLENSWFVSLDQPDGARDFLATVAGSMITVAGVTFSMTILTVSHATSNFGPRLLQNFMRDRGNQVTLGTFVATFLYCLMILRVIRDDASSDPASDSGVFVPEFSLMIALGLTLASVAQLIYFIHHVPDSIHISTVLQRLAGDMTAKMDDLYPGTVAKGCGDDQAGRCDEASGQKIPDYDFPHIIRSRTSGYLQGIDDAGLIEFAKSHQAVLRLLARPGEFIRKGQPLAESTSVTDFGEDHQCQILFGFTFGFSRTPTQDVFFILDEFVEVATRALSPGVNDPFTAMQCIDWLSVGLVQLSRGTLPTNKRVDDQGDLRIITTETACQDFVDVMLGRLVPYAEKDENVSEYLVDSMNKVISISDHTTLNNLINQQIRSIQLRQKD